MGILHSSPPPKILHDPNIRWKYFQIILKAIKWIKKKNSVEIRFRKCHSGNFGEHLKEILIRTFFGVPLTDEALRDDPSSIWDIRERAQSVDFHR